MDVWADDTAGVWLDNGTVTSGNGSSGTLLETPSGTLGPNCASSSIGCTLGNDAVIPLSLSAGTYTLVFDAYQLVSDTPFGVMYAGALTTAGTATPEPASYMLMGFGLVGLGAFTRRRRGARTPACRVETRLDPGCISTVCRRDCRGRLLPLLWQ